MNVVIVFESLWGNTESIAREIAAGVGDADVEVVRAGPDAVISDAVDLLIVGGPTHAFSMSRASTRESAAQQGATIPQMGIREWIEAQQPPKRAVLVATFDTKVVSPPLPGSAAKKAMKRLIGLGFQPIAKPCTFRVHNNSGPIADGELERARAWGAELAEQLRSR